MADQNLNQEQHREEDFRRRPAPRQRKKKHSAAPAVAIFVGILMLAVILLVITGIFGSRSPDTVPTARQEEGVVTIAAVGDIHMNEALMQAARTDANDYDFSNSFLGVADVLVGSDITVGNLECSFSGPDSVDKEAWAPDSLAGTLSGLGFDVLQTANSYAITGGLEGLTRSMEVVESAQMQPVGTSVSKKDYKENHGIVEVEANGMRVVFVAFTKGLNNMSLPEGTDYAVNLLYEDYDTNYSKIATDDIVEVMKAARQRNPDVLIALVHWGAEYEPSQSETQEKIADLLIQEGADAIIGSHSHFVGALETRTAVTKDDEARTALVAYDLGDFYSAPEKPGQQQSIVLQLEFTRDKRGNVTLTNSRYTPVYQVYNPDSTVAQYQVWDARLAMELYEQGYIRRVSREDYDAIAQAITEIAQAVNPETPEES